MNALRSFEAAARHLSLTKAGLELRVTQAAVSQQVRILEDSLGVKLFRRVTRGVALTEEGEALLPAISDAFGRINQVLDRFDHKNLNLDPAFASRVPTTENFSRVVFGLLREALPVGELACVRVEETENNFFECYGE